jgi:surface carbohydrate biosynthesis protein
MNLKTIFKISLLFWNSKKNWSKPKQAAVLIYDRCGAEYLLEYLDPAKVEILDIRRESINIYVLFKTIISGNLKWSAYVKKYLQCVSPSVAMTFIDNNPGFYLLKNAFPNIKTVFLQNGIRGEVLDVFKNLKPCAEFYVDHMLVFGSAIGCKYQEFIRGDFTPIGSVKNNLVPVRRPLRKEDVLFISQYCNSSTDKNAAYWVDSDGAHIYTEQFFAAERMVLRFLAQYCKKRGLDLKICGRSKENNGLEYEYFKKILGDDCWAFIHREGQFDSYRLLDFAKVVVFIDSTLGYEALARGSKAACFSMREFTLHNKATKFGWPAKLPDSGPFWTNHADEHEFERVMDYITNVDDKAWEETRQKYVPDLMEFDPGNTKFVSLMKELQVPLKEEDRF